jgi:hypothetical protein
VLPRRAIWVLPALAVPVALLIAGSAVFGDPDDSPIGLSRPTPTAATLAEAANLPATIEPFVDFDYLDRTSEPTPDPTTPPLEATDSLKATDSAAAPSSTSTTVSDTTTTTTSGATTTITSAAASTTTTTGAPATTTTTAAPAPPPSNGSGLRLWDTAWQIAAKADEGAMQQYVDRLAAASGAGGQNLTGFWFSVVNINQDINTPNGFGHSFGSFSSPDAAYLNDVERLLSMASGRSLKVGIVVAWDGPNQYSVENGKLTVDNAYQYGTTIAGQWTRPGFSGRNAIAAWIMGGDTTNDCCGGEHGAVWAEVVRGIKDAQAANGFSGPQILLHTAPGQHLNYVGASWLDAHAPQTGHCADAGTAVNWMQELANTGATIWGNGEMRYEEISWSCNGNSPITPQQVRDDVIAMKNLGTMSNFVYGFDPRWNASSPGSVGMSGSGVSAGLQLILDEPGLIRPR